MERILAKTLSLRWGLRLINNLGLLNLKILSDALSVVNCVLGKSKVASILPDIQGCWNLMANMPDSSIGHSVGSLIPMLIT